MKTHLLEFKKQFQLQSMVIPGIIFLIIFAYIPMYGLIISFQDYQIGDAMGFSKWVGLKNFIDFFTDPNFFNVMRNTICISFLKLLIGFPAPIIFAVMINEVKGKLFQKSVQTISYLPHFISWVAVSGIVIQFLSPDGGLINQILIGLHLIKEPILFLGKEQYFWGILVGSDLWKEIGWNAIIYLAAITAIDPALYEAASIDGAGRLRKIWDVTLPGIRPVIAILLIMSVAGILNAGMEQILLLTNNGSSGIQDVSEIIDTYVLKMGIRELRFSFATAIGLFKSLVAVMLLLSANKISAKTTGESLF